MPHLPDPFSLLGLPASFDLDARVIEAAYLQRAASSHPDLADEHAAEDADVVSGQLNEARQILLNAELRANTLLALRGGPSKESDKSLPPGFLMEIMETREQIEEALAARDPARLQSWREWALAQQSDYTTRVAALFRDSSSHKLVEIRTTLNAWRYLERLIEQLDSPIGNS